MAVVIAEARVPGSQRLGQLYWTVLAVFWWVVTRYLLLCCCCRLC